MFKKKQLKTQSNNRKLISKVNPRSPISEQYRTIRTNIEYSSVEGEIHSIVVTSAGPEEGKSTTVANLAVVFAQQGKKVLLIDADLRKPTIQYTFQVDNKYGLTNILMKQRTLAESIQHTDDDQLYILTCGPIPPNPAEILGSKTMEELLKEANEKFDIVLFDAPPVLAVTDAQILANKCDGTILVVASEKTENEQAIKAKELLESARGKLLGVVLNNKKQRNSDYYYYYGSK